MLSSKHVRPALLFIVILIYVAARLWRLDAPCLWFDEIFSIHAAEHPWGEMFNFIALDLVHPPLFYAVLKSWIAIGGESVYWLRLLPVLFATAAIAPIWLFTRALSIDRWAGILALTLLAVNGALIKYSQEVRMYSMLFFLSATSIWIFSRYFFRGKGWSWLLLVNILLVYTHYFGWMVIGCEIAVVLAAQRMKWRPILLMAGLVGLAFLPWVSFVFIVGNGSGVAQNIGWMGKPGLAELAKLAAAFTEPFHFQVSNIDAASVLAVSLPLLLIVVAAMIAFAFKGRDSGEKIPVRMLALFCALPIMTTFAVSWALTHSVWGTRHLIFVWIPAALLAGMAINAIPSQAWRTAAVTIVVLLLGYGFAVEFRRPPASFSWCAWEPLVRETSSAPAPIYTIEDLVGYHAWFAQRHSADAMPIFKLTNISGVAEDPAYFLPRAFDGVKVIEVKYVNDPALWLLFRDSHIREDAPPIRDLITAGYRVVDQEVIQADAEQAIAVLMKR